MVPAPGARNDHRRMLLMTHVPMDRRRVSRFTAALLGGALTAGLLVPGVALAANPTVTIDQAAGQADPTNGTTINFTVVFSESVTGFGELGDVTLSGSAGATVAFITGSGATYNVAVSGMTSSGTVIASIPAGVATGSGGSNLASTSTDNTVTWDNVAPTVTINQAAGQADPTNGSPINFTVLFSESVTGFGDAAGDVTIGGTAGGSKT